jgi:hypothetical protein
MLESPQARLKGWAWGILFLKGRPLGQEKGQKFSPLTGGLGNDLDKFFFYHYFRNVFWRDNLNFRGTALSPNSPSPQKEYQNLI